MKVKLILENKKVLKKATCCVLLTSYGRDTMLKRAIDSVLTQSYEDFILLIIDDNSPNINKKTQPIIKGMQEKDNRIIYFRTETTDIERANVSTFARNLDMLLSYVQGIDTKYISYLPCDDFYYPDRLKSAVSFLTTNKSVTSCFNYINMSNIQGRRIGRIPNTNTNSIRNPVGILDHSCVTHRVDVLKKMKQPYWPMNKSQEAGAPDGVFFSRLIAAGGAILKAEDKPQGEKTRHGNSIQGRVNGW